MDWRWHDIWLQAISCVCLACGFTSATECTRSCRLMDKNLHCWSQSLDFYTNSMFVSMDRYAATLLYLARWQNLHNDTLHGQVDILKNTSQSRTLESYLPDSDSAHPLERQDFEVILNIIHQRTAHLEHLYVSEEKLLPHFSCPMPCGYNSQIWFYISIVLFLILLLSCLAFYLFYRQQFLTIPGQESLLKDR